MFDSQDHDHTLDASGLNCPLPILKTKKASVTIEVGETLHVIATDPGADADFDRFAKQTGHLLKQTWEDNGASHFLFEKAAPNTA